MDFCTKCRDNIKWCEFYGLTTNLIILLLEHQLILFYDINMSNALGGKFGTKWQQEHS